MPPSYSPTYQTQPSQDPDPPVGIDPEQWKQVAPELRQQWANMPEAERQKINQQRRVQIQQETVPGMARANYQRQINQDAQQQLRGQTGGGQGVDPKKARKRAEAMIKETAPALEDPVGTLNEMMGKAGDMVPQVNFTEEDELQGIELDLSQINDAIDEFAKAKVQAAKQGARTGRVTARNANVQMLTNALGPGLVQALTGVKQPSFQPGNQQRAAQSAQQQYAQQIQRAEETEATAGAQAQMQKAEQELNAQKTEQESQMQADRFNTQLSKQIERQNASQQIDLGLAMTKLTQRSQETVMKQVAEKMKAAQEESGQQKIPGTVLRVETAWALANQHEQEAQRLNQIFMEINSMPSKAFGSFNRGDMERYAAERLAEEKGTTADQVLQEAQSNENVAQELEQIRKEGQQKYERLTDELIESRAYTPSQGLTKALGLEGKDGLAQQVRETMEEHEDFSWDLKLKAVIGISTEDSYTSQTYYNVFDLIEKEKNQSPGTQKNTDDVDDDTPSSSGVSIQGDPLGY